MVNFGEWIRYTQIQKGLTDEQCQSRAGMTQPNWSRLVNSPPQQPRKSTCESVARALDVPVSVVFSAAGYEDPAPSDVKLARQLEPYLMRIRPEKRRQAEHMLIEQAQRLSEMFATS